MESQYKIFNYNDTTKSISNIIGIILLVENQFDYPSEYDMYETETVLSDMSDKFQESAVEVHFYYYY